MRLMAVLLSISLALAASPGEASAVQHNAFAADTAYVLLTLAPRLANPGARASIIRPVGPDAPDVIMVTEATTPADLREAIRMLMNARHTFGPIVNREMHAHVPPATIVPMDLVEETAYLADLRTAEEIEVPGVGPQRSLFMALEERH